ncbi:hypothetical protein PHET_07747 [Paragonimus heterotremus]|uniref:Ionotropic glutamate receptor C-terminal domain-containing protein n=1 Tax=Paragonimus heterotremus TaxID=100268 RepID=A0A8J4TCX3_9TREM|nr:hypothetical protein PHET_07747 [Paragonimus heterotremus]
MDETVGILLRTPDSTTGLFQMLQPFKSHIWFLIFGSVLIVGFLLYAINRFSAWYQNRMGEEKENHREEVQLSENMWSTIKSLLFQVPETYPSVASARTILLSFWLLVLLTHVFWQADMTAYLTRNEQILPVNSLEELAEQDRIKPVLVKGTATHDAFKDPNANRFYQLIYQKYKSQNIHITSFSDVIHLVLNDSSYAVVAEQTALTYAVRKHCGELVLLTNNGENRNLGFAAPAKAVYVETLSKFMFKLKETGVIERLRTKWWSTRNKCAVRDANYKPLTLESSSGGLIILAAFICISLVILCLELAYYWLTRDRRIQPQNTQDRIVSGRSASDD